MLKTKKIILNKNFFNHFLSYRLNRRTDRKKVFANKLIIPQKFKQINFEQLVLFYIVVISGGINSASNRLSLSQPAISLALQKIEQELGHILFKKYSSIKSLVLTIYGSIFFSYIDRIFQILDEVFDLNNLNFLSSSLYSNKNFIAQKSSYSRFFFSLNKILTYKNIDLIVFGKVLSPTTLKLNQIKVENTKYQLSGFHLITNEFIELHTIKAVERFNRMNMSHQRVKKVL